MPKTTIFDRLMFLMTHTVKKTTYFSNILLIVYIFYILIFNKNNKSQK